MRGRGSELSVITPVSRPGLLKRIQHVVPDDAEWIVVADGAVDLPKLDRDAIILRTPQSAKWGHLQREVGLRHSSREFIYFLDDDNVMLPSLPALLAPILEHRGWDGLLVGLVCHYFGRGWRWPAPVAVRLGHVDTAMFFGRREAVQRLEFRGPDRVARGWPGFDTDRSGDFAFLEEFARQHKLGSHPALLGFHNGVDLLEQFHPSAWQGLTAERADQELTMILHAWDHGGSRPPWRTEDEAFVFDEPDGATRCALT